MDALNTVVGELKAVSEVTTPTSDLDLYVFTNGNQHWIEGRFVQGVEAALV